ncbi:MAG: hypothetical protein I8H80_01900 [Alphaproteobacteria bacterium]|nr:hypothetical protein [Alphaproteobacteria bacterium]
MQTVVRKVLCGIIFLTALTNLFAADLQKELAEPADPRFAVEKFTEYHPRLPGLLSISLLNATGDSLSNYRIIAMIKKNIHESFVPGNVTESVWRFVADDAEVVLPLLNLAFTLVIYRGDFDGVKPDRDVIDSDTSEHVFMLDGEELDISARALRLTAR